jgi:hypothetical protein
LSTGKSKFFSFFLFSPLFPRKTPVFPRFSTVFALLDAAKRVESASFPNFSSFFPSLIKYVANRLSKSRRARSLSSRRYAQVLPIKIVERRKKMKFLRPSTDISLEAPPSTLRRSPPRGIFRKEAAPITEKTLLPLDARTRPFLFSLSRLFERRFKQFR